MPAAVAVIDCVVAPFDHRYELIPAGAESVTLPPVQNVVGPFGVMTGDGAGLTATVVGCEVPVQPATSFTVTL